MKKIFVTTPIYYVNDIPHIGHAYTTISCDIIARYNRMLGNEVFFLTGTDEHGQKVENAASLKSLKPQDFVDKISKSFKDLIPFLNCSIDDFIRTTEERHKIAAQALWKKLLNNNQIYLSNYEGWYSVRDEAFYSENELTKKNDKFIAPSGAEVEWVKEESYFFKLSEWEDKLIEFYEKNKESILPKTRYNEVLSFIKSGLKDLSISRTTFKWGIPVPDNNKHVMYVWIDALCNYLTAIGFPDESNEKFKKFWPGIHIVGKDILRFHSVYWPAFLLAANLEPPKKVFAHGWWTNEGEKISKSIGNIINPYEIVTRYGLDQIRYYLFREVPFGNDGDFSNNSIVTRINADLSNNFGNLIQRICSFVKKNCESKIHGDFDLDNIEDKELLNLSEIKLDTYKKYMENQEFDKAIKEVFELITKTNIYIDKNAPWNLKKNNLQRMNQVISISIEIIRRSTILLYPIMPSSCEKIFSILNMNINSLNLNNYTTIFAESFTINNPTPIFPRIDND